MEPALLEKKATFQTAVRSLLGMLEDHTKLASLMPVITRAHTLLKTRYSNQAFWRDGRGLFEAAVQAAAGPGALDAAVSRKLSGFLQDACDFLREDSAQQTIQQQPAASGMSHMQTLQDLLSGSSGRGLPVFSRANPDFEGQNSRIGAADMCRNAESEAIRGLRNGRTQIASRGSSHFDDAGIIVDDETRWQRAQVSGTVQAAASPPRAETADSDQPGSEADGATAAASLTAAVLTAAQRRAQLQAELQQNIQDAMQAVAGSMESLAEGTQAVTEMDAIIAMLGADTPYRPSKPPASKKAVAALPKLCVTEEHLEAWGKGTACSVCTDELAAGEEVQVLPCKHVFHPPCLAPWLLQHNSCPMCRMELPTDDDAYELKKEKDAERAEERRGADNALPHNEFQYI